MTSLSSTETARENEKTEVIANAPWWHCLHCDSTEYEEHVFTGHMKGVPMVHCAKCKVLHSPPDPYSTTALRWRVRKLKDALENLLYLQDFNDDRAHWESEHRQGNGAAWRVLGAMDALDAIAMETRRAETTGSVGEADDSAAIAQTRVCR